MFGKPPRRSGRPYYKSFGDYVTGRGGRSGAQIQAEKDRRRAERERRQREYEARKAERDRAYLARQAERERKQREYELRKAERERKQREYEERKAAREREYRARQAERERKKQEYEARQAERERKKREYEERKAARAQQRNAAKNKPPRGGPRYDDKGRRIGRNLHANDRKAMESYQKAVLGETSRKQPYEGHHSHPTFLGGRRDQKLTDLPVHTHRRIHKDINQFMGMSGIQTAGKSAKDINTAFKDKKDVLKERLADFHLYGGACGGARDEYKPAAEDFFRQHPHLRKDAEKRMSDLKAEVAKHPARDEAKVIAAFYKDLDAKNNRK